MLKNGQTIVFILLHKIQASVSYFVFVISLIINRFSYNTHNMTSTYTLACNDTFLKRFLSPVKQELLAFQE